MSPCFLQVESKGKNGNGTTFMNMFINGVSVKSDWNYGMHLGYISWNQTIDGYECHFNYAGRYYMHGERADNDGFFNALESVPELSSFMMAATDTVLHLNQNNRDILVKQFGCSDDVLQNYRYRDGFACIGYKNASFLSTVSASEKGGSVTTASMSILPVHMSGKKVYVEIG